MKIYRYPKREEWTEITERPYIDTEELTATVKAILNDIKEGGDGALRKYEEKFDHVRLDSIEVSQSEIDDAVNHIPAELHRALVSAHHNIAAFHEAQKISCPKVVTQPGVTCWQKCVPIEKVGLYIPGGTAPLFSTVLMLATPAKIARCRDIVLCTPPGRDGKVNPAILAAASIAGVSRIFKAGGTQAIGCMAYGTESIPKVYKIFGPGNRYVMAAKQIVSIKDAAIDMPAGPSEVCVIADENSNPEFIAADLLSQAEHGTDSQVMLITSSEKTLDLTREQIETQLNALPRKDIAAQTLVNSKLILVDNLDEAIELSNMYAPEHLIIATDNYDELAAKVVNAGSVFLGKYACESAGDYASGTNHTLPTHGYAVAYSGVNLDSFMRKITFQHITEEGIANIGRTVEVMAENEMLFAHKNAMTVRINNLKQD
ncbi:histidinol dehydrogenase [Prevotella sp.]|uniref:histidinol dehydrogenase n=1 Tax=Prevotella sp. TaxID=59823 RepID=UPI003AB551C3